MQRTLYEDAHVTITLDDEARLVRYRRSREPYTSLEVLRALNGKLRTVFAALPAGNLRLLLDVRDAPPRNDDAFELEIGGELRALTGRFSLHATLVKSAVGRLQAKRLAQARTEQPIGIFFEEAEALAYLSNPTGS
jgi:hypothetical protein